MKNSLFLLFIIILGVTSCKKSLLQKEQPTVLTDSCEFDLAKITFKEKIPILFSEVMNNELLNFEDKSIDTTALAYYPYNNKQFTVPFKPADKFGYLYRSKEIQHIAKFDSVYFNSIEVLTDLDTIAVAVYANAKISTEDHLKNEIQKMEMLYGKPAHTYDVGHGFNVFSYEWNLSDRIIQIETGTGTSIEMSTDYPDGNIEEYYTFEILIIQKVAATEIARLKTLDIHGQRLIIRSPFLLNSLNEEVKNSNQFVY